MKNRDELNLALRRLSEKDEILAEVWRQTGEVPLRQRRGGFAGLSRIIVGQQLSVASAEAIATRLNDLCPEGSHHEFKRLADEDLRKAGLSAGKIRTLRAVAEAIDMGLDLSRFNVLNADQARRELMAIKGIGAWTADIYLMFCAGHPDRFAPGDLALRKAVGMAYQCGLPDEAFVSRLSENWSPYRTAAAWLLWAYFHRTKNRQGI